MAFDFEAFYAQPVEVAFGRFRNDMEFRNWSGTFGQLLEKEFGGFATGPKDGRCMTQAHTTTGRRIANNMSGPTLIMVDHDTGATMDDVASKYEAAGLYALLWNTHSHLKDESDVAEGALAGYLKSSDEWRSQGHTAPAMDDDETLLQQVVDYFREVKRYVPQLLDTMHTPRRDVRDGVRYIVSHAPMHKLRSLLVLDQKFDLLSGGMQRDRITEWKERYAGFSLKLGVPYDRSCVDPSRLMYLPRMPRGADPSLFEIREVEGRVVTLDDMPRYNPNARSDERAAFAQAAKEVGASIVQDETTEFKTRNIRQFMARGGTSFAIAEWLREVAHDDVRAERDAKLTLCCPNDDNHSNAGDPNDHGFWVQNAQDREESTGFIAACSHDTCRTMSDGDRAWYIDLLCQKYDVADALELRTWCDDWKERDDDPQTQEEADAEERDFKAALDALPETPTPAQLVGICTVIARGANGVYEDRRISAVMEKVGRQNARRATLVSEVRAARQRLSQQTSTTTTTGESVEELYPVPSDPSSARVIWDVWGHSDRRRVAIAVFEKKNNDNPRVFINAEGSYVRVHKRAGQTYLEPVDSTSAWSSILSDCMTFKCAPTERSPEKEVRPFDDIVTYLHGARVVNAPRLKRVINVPMFGANGELRTEEGYCPAAECWLDPSMPFRPVHDIIGEEDLAEAVSYFWEALIDFPFSDVFDGSRDLPVKSGEIDADGHKLPTFERGMSSRSHAIAMCLSPFVRAMMHDGKAPAFLIDKSEPGTGAGYLADVLGYMLYNNAMPPKDLPLNEEEVSKVLLASLIRGKPVLFLDNINHDVDSASLAAAITASSIEGRILGTSTYVDVPVESTLVLAANNGKLTDELMRRVIPIRLDAALPNPSVTRKPDFYKYVLHDFLRKHRADLVWAAHIMVKWWLQCGSPSPSHGRRLQSFGDWSRVVGGVLEYAGIEGFLESLPKFQAARNDDRDDEIEFLKRVLNRYPPGKFWSTSDAYGCACPMGSDTPDPELGLMLNGRDPAGMTRSLGRYIKKWVGKTYDLKGQRMRIVPVRDDGKRGHMFVVDEDGVNPVT